MDAAACERNEPWFCYNDLLVAVLEVVEVAVMLSAVVVVVYCW